MHLNRTLLSFALVVVALIVQVSLLARLQLPGATPDLLLLIVLSLALVYGHVGGCLVGFGAGLLADLAPPSDHAVGRYALVLCVVGYVAGLTKPGSGPHRSATAPMLVVATAAVSSTLLYAGVGTLIGDTSVHQVGLVGLLLTATLYDLLLAPFTVPLAMALARRTTSDPVADNSGSATSDSPYGWLSAGTGIRARRSSRAGRNGKPAWSSGRRSILLSRLARNRAGRIKGVKRL